MRAPVLRSRRSGMTLLEVLLAVTLLAIVMTLVLTVFQSATSSLKRGRSEVELLQRARFALDTLETDLLNVQYRDETSYNLYMNGLLNQFETAKMEAEASGDFSTFEATYGEATSREQENDPTHVGNPYEKGRLIDLSFSGGSSEGGKDGHVTFARRRPRGIGGADYPIGLSRVSYQLNNGTLTRTEDLVEAPKMTIYGEVAEEREPLDEEPLADGVVSFDLTFSFWFDNQWYETNSWDSSERLIRSSACRLVPDRGSSSSSSSSGLSNPSGDQGVALQPGDPGWNEYLNSQQNQPFDGLPSYVRVRVAIANDPAKPEGGKRVFQRIVRLPGSQETFVPDATMDPKIVAKEQNERDLIYKPILPGAMMLERK